MLRAFQRNASHLAELPILKRVTGNRIGTERFAKEQPRVNEVGIQYLSENLRSQLFTGKNKKTKQTYYDKVKINLSQQYLQNFNLLNKKTNITEPIALNLPTTAGKTLNEHFIRLALHDSAPYDKYAEVMADMELPERPKEWVFKPGWYRYDPNSAEPVPVAYPTEDMLVFDVETMYQVSPYPVMATAASPVAWYGWVSPYLTDADAPDRFLIPMDTQERAKLVIGHNIAYDRARIKDEYSVRKSRAFYLDTLSLHVAATGICSRQRPVWLKFNQTQEMESKLKGCVKKLFDEKNFYDYLLNDQFGDLANDKALNKLGEEDHSVENPWVAMTSTNSLANVALLHCNLQMNKADRDYFKSTDKAEVVAEFQRLMHYCAGDVYATHQVFKKVFPLFRERCPHPVSFSALRHINSIFLPTSYNTWESYIQNAERLYQNNRSDIEKSLATLAHDLVRKFQENPAEVLEDPWYAQLNWEVSPVRLTKNGTPYKRQKMPGYPEWYRSLFPSATGDIKLTIRTRIVPILLRLRWEGHPLIWTESRGWCFRVRTDQFTRIHELVKKNYARVDDFTLDPNFETLTKDYRYAYFKVPHPNAAQRTTTLTSKSFLPHYEKQVMTSEYDIAEKVLALNAAASYWISSRERIMNQFVVYETPNPDPRQNIDFSLKSPLPGPPESRDPVGIIIPQILPMGTITRRAVEKTWLTASNVKKNRIGSELKTKIEAPLGYSFVGADVDSEELWIASLLSDSVFKIHGGSAIGWMTLEGNKLEKTDLHSKTAEILGISRNEAKIFNYSRIYGAGLKHTSTLLKQFNPTLTEQEIIKICNNLFDSTKGKTIKLKPKEKKFFQSKGINLTKIWYGGSESVLFNKLENLAETSVPKTPVLKAGITEALKKENLNSNSFLPSRINWAIQSSGVDYLHLLIVSMEFLINKYKVDARLCITVHDEIRYLVKDEDRYKVALLLQIANVWTRGIFCEQLGISDIPQSCAFFSQVDIDKILRKEVDTPCETPSNKNVNIPNGESLDIVNLLDKLNITGNTIEWLNSGEDINLSKFKVDHFLARLLEGKDKENPLAFRDSQEAVFINMQIEQDTNKVMSFMKRLVYGK